jgi:outer membrane murein-binding lipoprotein Lpp
MRSNLPRYTALAMIAIGGVGLGGCASKGFVREQIATVNTRIDGLDGRLRTVEGTSGQALTQAQAASAQAQQNSQRIDQINGRVDGLDQQMKQQMQQRQRRPRG